MHDTAHDQSWTGGPYISPEPMTHAERAQAYADLEMELPPLYNASQARVEACRLALALSLLAAGCPVSEAARLSQVCVERLQEPLG
jgi:hypothetical protein